MIPAGRRDRLVTIERPTKTQNARGEVVLSWPGTVFVTLWGTKLGTGGRETQAARQQHGTGAYHWEFGFVPGVTSEMRLNDRGVYADIVHVDDTRRRQGELHLEVVERGV